MSNVIEKRMKVVANGELNFPFHLIWLPHLSHRVEKLVATWPDL
jgi:hypothetical protein